MHRSRTAESATAAYRFGAGIFRSSGVRRSGRSAWTASGAATGRWGALTGLASADGRPPAPGAPRGLRCRAF
ncbi:hypothetical protein B1A74_08725 [Thioalkalivibrio halophilus]|uniref:Uncharacterized protein n=1 Tax=Thioalkalivibrio halophilus TaxID=252474 RepID=A0A1V2ZXM9_9GAMM|nr:hypothetical protein B1A74_08725 [Thioalkalivibrio halophilus]